MTSDRREPDSADIGRGYEQRDVEARAIVWLLAGVGAAVMLSVVGLWLAWGVLEREARREDPALSPLASGPVEPPAPGLQAAPLADYQAHRAREEQLLTSYGWVDRPREVARIPIDRAIELLVERGEPRVQPPPSTPSAAPQR